MVLDAQQLKGVLGRFHDGLVRHEDALNRLNVYPVPDGDTGTNMTLTVRSVVGACEAAVTIDEVAEAMARGSLMGARGNSGVILSQILRGLAETFRGAEAVGVAELVSGLSRAADSAYESVVRPVEGTILTVAREAATGAREAAGQLAADLGSFLNRVYNRAEVALESTPSLLPALARAGVVDAGGAGLLLFIGAFVEEVEGTVAALPEAIVAVANSRAPGGGGEGGPDTGDFGDRSGGDPSHAVGELRYEVMFFLDAPDDAIVGFRSAWADLGDSIVVVGGDGLYNCHIHTDDIGAVIEAGIGVGRPHEIRVTDLLEQAGVLERGSDAPGSDAQDAGHYAPLPEFAAADPAVVVVAAGAGVVSTFRDLGAAQVVAGGQSMNPSTEELLAAVEASGAERVIILPNNKNIIPVADQVDALTTKTVAVVPTRSVTAGIAAMLAYTPSTELGAVAAAMEAESASVVSGEITRAVRDSETDAGHVRAGDWIGIADGVIRCIADSEASILESFVSELAADEHELLTVISGAESAPDAVASLLERLRSSHPDLEVEVVVGDQPVYPYLLSIE